MKWKSSWSVLIFGSGLGLFLHDRIVEWNKGEAFMARIHGLDIGVILICISFITLSLYHKILFKEKEVLR